MQKDSKIYIAGHRGLVGSAILKELKSQGFSNFVTKTHSELDLLDQPAVLQFFEEEKPDYVVTLYRNIPEKATHEKSWGSAVLDYREA